MRSLENNISRKNGSCRIPLSGLNWLAKAKQTEMFEVDVITLAELKERTAELNAAIAKYENELRVIRGNPYRINRIDELVGKYCSSIQGVLTVDIIDNAMLRKVIDKIVVTVEGEIQVYFRLFSDLDISYTTVI